MQTLGAAACTCMCIKRQPGDLNGTKETSLFCKYWSDTLDWLCRTYSQVTQPIRKTGITSFAPCPRGTSRSFLLYTQMTLTPLLSRTARHFWWHGTGFLTTAGWPCPESTPELELLAVSSPSQCQRAVTPTSSCSWWGSETLAQLFPPLTQQV